MSAPVPEGEAGEQQGASMENGVSSNTCGTTPLEARGEAALPGDQSGATPTITLASLIEAHEKSLASASPSEKPPPPPPPQPSEVEKPNVPLAFMNRKAQQDDCGEPGVPAAFKKLKAGMKQSSVLACVPNGDSRAAETGAKNGFGWDAFLNASQGHGAGSWGAMQNSAMWPATASQQCMPLQGCGGHIATGFFGPGIMQSNGMQGFGGASMMVQGFGAAGMNPMMAMPQPFVAPGGMLAGSQGMQGFGATGAWPEVGAGSGSGLFAATTEGSDSSALGDMTSEQAAAVQEAVAATQHAQYMQQVQFLQQMKAKATQDVQSGATGTSRFVDDYRAFRLCKHFQLGECWQGARCVYAHCFEELHPASPDMPKDENGEDSAALAEMKPPDKEKESAPNMRLRKKRDLCKRFTDTGNCVRGKACPNAHGEQEIGQMAFVLYDKVKLTICNHWERGKCSYGDNCIHAHGDHEIGQKRREFYDMAPVKRRRDGESIEDFRAQILRDPTAPCFPGQPRAPLT